MNEEKNSKASLPAPEQPVQDASATPAKVSGAESPRTLKPVSAPTDSGAEKRGPGRPRKSPKGEQRPEVKAGTGAETPLRSERSAAAPGPEKKIAVSKTEIESLLQMFAGTAAALSWSICSLTPGNKPEFEQIAKATLFTPGELGLIAPAAEPVLNKLLPEWLKERAGEIHLGQILVPILLTKVLAIVALKNPELLPKAMQSMTGAKPKEPKAPVQAPAINPPPSAAGVRAPSVVPVPRPQPAVSDDEQEGFEIPIGAEVLSS